MSTSIDLRETSRVTEAVRKLAYRAFGFREYLVRPLEADGEDVSRRCKFRVCGVTYLVEDGALSVCGRGDGE